MHSITNTELSSHEETRFEFNRSTGAIKLGIDVHQDFYVVVEQVSGSNPKPPQRFAKQAFLRWATKLKQSGAQVHAVYEACGFGFWLRLGAPIPPVRVRTSSSTLIALIKLLLRLRSHARIGVGAAGNKTNEQEKEEEALQRKLQPRLTNPYELTNHLPTLACHS